MQSPGIVKSLRVGLAWCTISCIAGSNRWERPSGDAAFNNLEEDLKNITGALALTVLLAIAANAPVFAEEMAKPAAPMNPMFEKLKSLTGEWTGTTKDGPFTVSYRVTAAGSAVVETMFPGTQHEMITVYHMDRSDIVLTHYCAAQNQPMMRAKAPAEAASISFTFDGGSNMDPAIDGHMHDATMTFVDNDTLHTEWAFWQGGAKKQVESFDLKRKKS